ncbi:MAG: RNase adapter protein RapZ [Pseudothermotoga sp.]|nr:RNase adapter protein RapZ [Pseudothermotoga sp.]MDK2884096.1 RNase adapter protein RapZ [Pseudothermotoga sp.]
MSGAGKSTVARVLEDIGFFCIDNLPPALLNDFMVLLSSSSIDKVALVVDIRSAQLGNAVQAIKKLVDNYSNIVTVLFLEASDEELLKRFATTRRRHPLEGQLSLQEAISKEKELLRDMKEMSVVIDTTGLDIHTLREKIGSLLKEEAQFVIRIRSFGFKYGLPADTDFIIDTRFLPNPYYDRKLAQLNGTDQEIVNFFSKYPVVEDFIQYTYKLLHIAATRYKSEGRPFMTVSIGCTGGRHRSVYVAEKLSKILKDRFYVYVEHRDVNK